MTKLIRTSFDIVTPESAEHGDFAETGWIDEAGHDCTPDEFDLDYDRTAVDVAVKFLLDSYVVHASCYPNFQSGVWYSTSGEDMDPRTGERETHHFHLDGFTEEEEEEVYRRIIG